MEIYMGCFLWRRRSFELPWSRLKLPRRQQPQPPPTLLHLPQPPMLGRCVDMGGQVGLGRLKWGIWGVRLRAGGVRTCSLRVYVAWFVVATERKCVPGTSDMQQFIKHTWRTGDACNSWSHHQSDAKPNMKHVKMHTEIPSLADLVPGTIRSGTWHDQIIT